ncbi:uncharacterized protein N7498_007862 [Penicillium cinerascens]|uniref:Uncharacterized protein n=1 Tax=Penicillium cinerascens TaxID=70096 RepID=A0A9W9MDR9_9EURO|nr:uncharacterized protein N7498_007862 [Penicillium cinerascens]KAJ5198745.1 hypothetical protein N7498_007862 [Penicillium cinerascens]
MAFKTRSLQEAPFVTASWVRALRRTKLLCPVILIAWNDFVFVFGAVSALYELSAVVVLLLGVQVTDNTICLITSRL